MSSPSSAANNGAPAETAEALFYKALDLPPEEREAFLGQACGTDEALRAEVLAYLHHYNRAGSFLKESPAASADLQSEFARLKPEEAGERIGPYKLVEQIGEGGFGTVWVAEQEQPIRRRAALKIIKLGMDTKDVVARFEQERQALALMDHPNIARVLDAGATPFGRPFFVMELVPGVKITDYCDSAKLRTHERLRLFIEVCHAVQHAHQKGIIHRDLKPSNILVTLHDGVPVPKVIDFGVAKATQKQRFTDLTIYTQFEQMIGTPLYMSPEQAELSGLDIDTRSDIYSLGVLLYEILTGRTPFDPEHLMQQGYDEIRRVIREDEPPKPSTHLSTLPLDARTTLAQQRQTDSARFLGQIRGDLDWIVMKALEKDRTRRYETALGFARDLERHLDSKPVHARPPTASYRFRRFARRNKFALAAGTALLAALIGGISTSTWMYFQEKHARKRAVAAEQEQARLRQVAETAEKAQDRERQKAEGEARNAEREASKSRQVAQFLTDMLKGVGPSVALGRDTKLLREILDKTAERVSKDLEDHPEVEADLRKIIGDVYFELGDYEQSRAMHTEALAIRKKTFGNEHPDVAASLASIANVLLQQGKTAEAESMHREALAMWVNLLGNENSHVAASLNNLASVLKEEGKLTEAEVMYREALAMRRKLFGSEDRAIAESLHNVAGVLLDQGKLIEAEAMFRQAIAMDTKLLGSEHPDIANSLNSIAKILWKQGKFADAESMFRDVLAMDRKLLGNEHPDVASTLNNLAVVLADEDKLSEAESMHRDALALQKRLLGDEHHLVAASLNNLAKVLSLEGKLQEAEIVQREAAAMQRKLLGNDHPDVASSLSNVAISLQQQNKLAEAEVVYREVLAMQKRLLSNGYPNEGGALLNLVGVLCQEGKLSEAESAVRQELEIQKTDLGDEHPAVARSLSTLTALLVSQGKLPEAEVTSREALAIDRKSATGPIALDDDVNHLAETLFREGKFAESEPLYRELLAVRQARLPAEDPAVISATASLGRLLSDWVWKETNWVAKGRTENRAHKESAVAATNSQFIERAHEAARLLRECLAAQLRISKPKNWHTDDSRSRLGAALIAVAVTEPTLSSAARQATFAEAEALILEGNKGVQQNDDADRKHKRDALNRVVRLYQAWNKPKQLAEWQRKLADFEKAIPLGDPR